MPVPVRPAAIVAAVLTLAGCSGTVGASGGTPPPAACTSFTYGAWTPAVCPESGVQTRAVSSAEPAGCTGGSPVLTQACTPGTPVCTAFTYGEWTPATCPPGGTQTRAVVSAEPAGCTGGSPVLTQPCGADPGTATNLEKLQALATKRMWFAHMSVGINVWYGAVESPTQSPAAGLGRIILDNPGSGATFGQSYAATRDTLAALPAGRFAETSLSSIGGPNSFPLLKIEAFRTALGADFGGGLDHAALKFCFADFDTTIADADAVWAEYEPMMDAYEAQYPGRIIFWTVPVTTYEGANVFRERMSSYIRTKYGPTGRVFDIADYESRDASGNLVLGSNGLRTMNPAWHSDGSHLNAAGATYIAQKYLDFMYGVASR